ncbi:MAG TPA: LysR family transcriptional regulator, partial [Candidatus Babeliaceae bacterium]|nr:LysR family transcriptional regulator [Candidatus Babeliaceae bacterium]
MLDFRLRVFYTVAKLLNFTKAAATLHISQPAVTKHIKELEQSYKVTLFDRQPNALSLTDAGKILYKHATVIMEQYDLLEFDINALNDKIAGNLRIAASTTIAQYVLPPVLASFNQRMPDVAIHLINDNSSRVQQMLLEKIVDVGFIEGKTGDHNLQYIPYLKDEIVLVCSRKNNELRKETIDIDDLKKLQFVVREDESGTFEIVSEQLKNAGIAPEKLKA